MKFKLLVISALAFSTQFATATGKSAKKMAANETNLSAPQVVEKGDNMIGARMGQGDVFDSKPMVGVNYERMLTQNFGVGGMFNYASYTHTFNVGGYRGTWEYDAYAFAAYGSLHADVFKVKNLDTYVTAGVGRTVIRSHWTSNNGLGRYGDVDGDSNYLLAYVNARYFINSAWAFTASVGAPIGTLALGMDYLF